MKIIPTTMVLVLFGLAVSGPLAGGAESRGAKSPFLVEDGKARAQIIIGENPARMTKLAAEEFRDYVKKITGAELSIDTKKDGKWPAQIYIGRSSETDALGIKDDGLEDGAYRMVSGKDWLVLLGRDRDFTPIEPWSKSLSEARTPEEIARWDAVTGSQWGNEIGGSQIRSKWSQIDGWEADERGSLNAVYDFLRSLGVEWYMPGDLGEIVPETTSIELPKIDKLVRPDFGLRFHAQTPFFRGDTESILWYLRMGLNSSSSKTGMGIHQSHGMRNMHGREEMMAAHPDYYALREGKRVTRENQPCLSSEGLFQEHLKYIRFLFDYYDMPMVGLTPEDGAVYCECALCKDKATPKRGVFGNRSDYVWDYYNRIAKEILKTHPHKLLSACAYANYALPPENIAKLSPNLVVGLVQQRKTYYDPEVRQNDLEIRKAWQEKMGPEGKFIMWTHYPYTVPGRPAYATPEYFPHQIADDLRNLKGNSLGEFIEVQFKPETGSGLHAPGFNHLNSYVTARLYWDADGDVNALLENYYTRFYGPARNEMKAFIEYCEANWMKLKKDALKIDEMFALLKKAQEKAPPDSVYGKRIALLAEFIEPLQKVRNQLAKGHKSTVDLRTVPLEDVTLTVDGNLDEEVWSRRMPGQGDLKESLTGGPPRSGTGFRIFWTKEALYLGISCDDRDMEGLASAPALKDEDPEIWKGDFVSLLLETQNHSYYDITVSPTGAWIDADRRNGEIDRQWASEAQVAVMRNERGWTAELRIPLMGESHIDHLHNVVGEEPSPTYPWYFNIGRMRVRGEEKEMSALAPTKTENFYDPMTFARLFMGIPAEAMKEYERRSKE